MANLADTKNPRSEGDAFAAIVEVQKTCGQITDFAGGPLSRESISEEVSGRILALIKSGDLRSGERLPTEQQMCRAFGIRRPPLREAPRALTLDQNCRVAEAIAACDAETAMEAYRERLDHILAATMNAIHQLSE